MSSIHLACEEFDTVSFESCWKKERECHDATCQTSNTNFCDGGNQTVTKTDFAVQTLKDPFSTNFEDVDFNRLSDWLSCTTPQVLKELENASKSRAFYGYKPHESCRGVQTKLLYVLDGTSHKSKGFVSCLTWSSTGGVLALSYCFPRHPSWCDHSGLVVLYYINRQDFKPSAPNRKLETGACVTVISFHPTEPYILACGTFSGEVLVWNLQREEPIVLGSSALQSESITYMEWVRLLDASQTKLFLATASQDGSVFIWNVKIGSNSLKNAKSFLLQSEKIDLDLGIACAAFHPKNSHYFLVGVDGGRIFLCSTESKRPLSHRRGKHDPEILDFHDPILASVDGHKGPVTGIYWHVHDTDKFFSSGTDSELHIYSSSQLTLLAVVHLVEPCLGMAVCLPQPHLVALWGSSGHVYLFNVTQGKELMSLKSELTGQCAPLSYARFQGQSSSVVAVGNINGLVFVWQLPVDDILEEAL